MVASNPPFTLKYAFLYARNETSDVLWYGVRPSVSPLATSCLLNIFKSF